MKIPLISDYLELKRMERQLVEQTAMIDQIEQYMIETEQQLLAYEAEDVRPYIQTEFELWRALSKRLPSLKVPSTEEIMRTGKLWYKVLNPPRRWR